MFEHELHQDEEQQRSGWRRLSLLLGGIIIVAGLLLLAWKVIVYQASPARNSIGTTSGAPAVGKSGQGDPPIYWQTIEEQVAQGLHLTVAQVKTKLQPPPGQRDSLGIAYVAAEQGISPVQLRTIELNAAQKGHDLLVRMGLLTKQESDQGMQSIRNWSQATLDQHVTNWFLEH